MNRMPIYPIYIRHSYIWLLILTSCGMVITGCGTLQAQKQQYKPQPLLLFQKTPCFGSCIAYNATIYSDGSIAYVPYEKGAPQDTLPLQLKEQEFQQLKQEMQALNHKTLQSSYLSGWSDGSSTYLTFYENGKEVKRVKHQEGGPEALIQFQSFVAALLERLAKE